MKWFTKRNERPVRFVPVSFIVLLIIMLSLQIGFHFYTKQISANTKLLEQPPAESRFILSALSDRIFAAKSLMLWLQSFDNQPGISIPFRELNYEHLKQWLELIQGMDENSHYALLSASRLYSKVQDNQKKRLMLDFVKKEYLEKPDERWRWMAHCVYVAKYELNDLELALEYARLLRENTSWEVAPAWATQMEIFILEELDQIESAKILIGGLLESGQISDEHELRFLHNRLEELEQKNNE